MAINDDETAAQRERLGSLKPPGLGSLIERLVGDDQSVFEQVDRNARALAKTALSKLDVVSRSEFDAQAAVLQRTRAKVDELEQALAALSAELDKADDN